MKIFGHIDDVMNKLAVDARVLGREIGNMPGKLAVDARVLGQKIDNLVDSIAKEKLWRATQENIRGRRAERDIMGCPIDK